MSTPVLPRYRLYCMERSDKPTWYRNHGSRYHLPREDWIQSGRAVCNALIDSPSFASTEPEKTKNGACVRCAKRKETE